MKKKLILTILFFILFLIFSFNAFCVQKEIAIFYRDDIPLHKFLNEKIIQYSKEKANLEIKTFPVNQDPVEIKNIIKARSKDSYFVAIGDSALELILNSGIETIGHYILISNNNLIEKAEKTKNWIGNSINVPYNLQFEITLKCIPQIDCVGCIYTDKQKDALNEFLAAAKKYNLDVKSIKIKSSKEVIPAINSLFQECRIFWIFPDPELVNDITIQTMTLLQYQLKKPIIGIGNKSVAMGALMSVNYDINQIPELLVDTIYNFFTTGIHSADHCCKNAIKIYYNSKTARMLAIRIEIFDKFIYQDVVQ